MLQAIVVNKESFIKVNFVIHLLLVIVVQHSYVFVQIALIKDAMEALCRPDRAVILPRGVIFVADALVSHWKVAGHLCGVFFSINFVVETAETVQARFYFHLIAKGQYLGL